MKTPEAIDEIRNLLQQMTNDDRRVVRISQLLSEIETNYYTVSPSDLNRDINENEEEIFEFLLGVLHTKITHTNDTIKEN